MNNSLPKISLLVGNILEWYDFAIYGFFTHIFAQLFFPHLNKNMAILATITGFSIGFLMRPIGGLLIGMIGDKYGKRRGLLLSLSLMFFPALIICITPTYTQIGNWAPLILLIARLLQGFSSGGELVNVTYTLQDLGKAPQKKLNLLSISLSSAYSGVLLAAFVTFIFYYFSSSEFLTHTAWRLCFALGAIISISGLLWRIYSLKIKNSVLIPTSSEAPNKINPSLAGFKLCLELAPAAFINYFIIAYTPVLLINKLHFAAIYTTLAIALLMLVIIAVIFITRKLLSAQSLQKVCRWQLILLLIFAWPALNAINSDYLALNVLGLCTLSIFFGSYISPCLFRLLYIFKQRNRLATFGLCYNLCYAIFGGTAPLISQLLHNHVSLLTLYLSTLAIVALICNKYKLPNHYDTI